MNLSLNFRRLAAWLLVGSAVGLAAGCRDAPPAAAPEPPGGLRSGSLKWQGRERTFLWRRGRAAADGPAPLLVVLHGSGGSGAEMAAVSGFDTLADRAGCVVAFPNGVARTWADGRGATPAERAGVDDVGFIRRLVGRLRADTAVDPARVYAAGYSNGGMMVQRLALEAPDLLAAGASVGAGLPERLAARQPARPAPPLLLIHGTDDPVVPWAGGEVNSPNGGRVLPAPETARWWAQAAGADPAPVSAELPDRHDDGTRVRTETFPANGAATAQVVLVVVEGGGHGWPGEPAPPPAWLLGPATRELDAAQHIWEFLCRYRRPAGDAD
ncbi:MAG TPA: PHB depolymerase family esterase [Acidobacteriota bacterium]|nr:PHB depolymerase family esterase [Acidobacteriota bacterium]HQM63035.1 PHB depolymerase family esterase [Acidobacteriota bacterium]